MDVSKTQRHVHLAFWYQLQLKIPILPQNNLFSEW